MFGTLQLRLSSGAHQGRLIELSARKCSIGSAPQCTLRLRSSGIEPVHCLIDRSGSITWIRRHAGQSLVNGQPFEQSPLDVGDRLRLGPLEFEVVLDAKPELQTTPPAVEASAVPESSQPQAPPAVLPAQPSSEAKSHVGGDGVSSDPFRQLDARFEDLEQRLTELGRTLLPARLDAAAAEAESQLERQREQLATQVIDTLRPQLAGDISLQVSAQVSAQVTPQVAAEIDARLGPQVAEATAQLGEELTSQLESRLSERLISRLSTQLSAESAARIAELVDQRVDEQISESSATLARQLSSELAEQLSRQVPDEVRQQVDGQLTAAAEQLGLQLADQVSGQVAQAASESREQLAGQVANEVASRVLPEMLARLDQRTGELADEVAAEVLPRVSEHVTAQLSEQLEQQFTARTARLESTLTERLTCEISQQVSEDLAPRLTVDVARRVASDVAPRVAAEVTAEVAERLSAQLVKDTTSRVAASVMPQVATEVASRTGPELVRRVSGEVVGQVMSLVSPQLESGLASWETARANWAQRQQQIELEFAEHCAELDKRVESIVELEQQAQSQRHLQEQDQALLQPQFERRIEQIEQALAEVREQHADWIQQRDQWRQTLDALRNDLEQRAEKTHAQLSRIEARWETFEHEQLHRQTDHENSTSEQISQRLAGIRAEREAFESERHDRGCVHPGEHVRQIGDRLAEIQARRGAPRDRQSQWPEEPATSSAAVVPGEDGAEATLAHRQADSSAAETIAAACPWPASETSVVANESLAPAPDDETNQGGADRTDEPQIDGVPFDSAPTDVDVEVVNAEGSDEIAAEPAEESVAEETVVALPEPFPSAAEASPSALASPLTTDHSPSTSTLSNDEDDESIDAYMARLMQRVRSISPDSPQASTFGSPRKEEAPASRASHATEDRPPTPVSKPDNQPEAEAPILDLSELAPRSLPAELSSNISAMRDLANMSARSAIDTHQRKRLTSVIYSKLTVAIAALMAAVALAWMSNETNKVSYAAALVSMVVGVVWGLQYLLLSGSRLFQSSAVGAETQDEPGASDD